MLQKIEDLQRQLATVTNSVDAPCPPKAHTISYRAAVDNPCPPTVHPISDLAANPAAHDAFDVEENTDVAFGIPQSQVPFVSFSKLTFPDQVSQCGSFV